MINKIIEIKDCCRSKDKIVLNQVLNSQEVELFIKLKMQNGANKINIFIKIKRREYEKIKLNIPIEIKLLIIPSNENIVNSSSLIEI